MVDKLLRLQKIESGILLKVYEHTFYGTAREAKLDAELVRWAHAEDRLECEELLNQELKRRER